MAATATTWRALATDATARLREAGHAEPRRQALALLAARHGGSVADLLLAADETPTEAQQGRVATDLERLIAGAPLAHVTGWAGFRHLTLRSDPRGLIPRPETEGVVEHALGLVRHGVAADIGTGSGAIALALQMEGEFDRVIGVDLSPEALALARDNAALTGLTIDWREGDLVAPLVAAGERVDLLVSNPPYLTAGEYDSLDPAVRDHEPSLALVSGLDGLTATRRLFDEARQVMVGGGWLVVEIDARRPQEVMDLATTLGWRAVAVHDDLFGRPRTVVAQWGEQ